MQINPELRQPGRLGPYSWEPVEYAPREWFVTRDGSTKVSRTWTKDIKAHCQAMWREEKEAFAAQASDDPQELCRLGWHQKDTQDGRRVYFLWMGNGRIGERLPYWVGTSPIRWTGTRIAGLGPQATPWHCSVCNRYIPALDYQPPPRPDERNKERRRKPRWTARPGLPPQRAE